MIGNKPDEFMLDEERTLVDPDTWEDCEWREERERVISKSSTAWLRSLRCFED